MLLRSVAIGVAAALVVNAAPAVADPSDHWEKQWGKRADCDEKLYEAKSPHDFYKAADECNRELAKLDREHRREAAKDWREVEKKWRERYRDYDGPYYHWDD